MELSCEKYKEYYYIKCRISSCYIKYFICKNKIILFPLTQFLSHSSFFPTISLWIFYTT